MRNPSTKTGGCVVREVIFMKIAVKEFQCAGDALRGTLEHVLDMPRRRVDP